MRLARKLEGSALPGVSSLLGIFGNSTSEIAEWHVFRLFGNSTREIHPAQMLVVPGPRHGMGRRQRGAKCSREANPNVPQNSSLHSTTSLEASEKSSEKPKHKNAGRRQSISVSLSQRQKRRGMGGGREAESESESSSGSSSLELEWYIR